MTREHSYMMRNLSLKLVRPLPTCTGTRSGGCSGWGKGGLRHALTICPARGYMYPPPSILDGFTFAFSKSVVLDFTTV